METLEDNTLFATLLSIYGGLLGKAELRRGKKHFFLDLSIAEIAQEEKTSRNAVYLSLKTAKKKLLTYEKVLKLSEKEKKTILLLDRIEGSKNLEAEDCLAQIRRLWSHGI